MKKFSGLLSESTTQPLFPIQFWKSSFSELGSWKKIHFSKTLVFSARPIFQISVFVNHMLVPLKIFIGIQLTLSATPPGRMVLTTTPVLRPPIIPKARPDPSFTRSITSTCAHSVFNCKKWNIDLWKIGKLKNISSGTETI